jgi:hypothetical protein
MLNAWLENQKIGAHLGHPRVDGVLIVIEILEEFY